MLDLRQPAGARPDPSARSMRVSRARLHPRELRLEKWRGRSSSGTVVVH